MIKKNKTSFIFVCIIILIFCFNLGNFASAETCSGECNIPIDGKCPTGKTETGEAGCNAGLLCCKDASSGETATTFPNPIGVNSVQEFLNKFLASMRGIVAVVAIIFIVLGGILYMLSAGNEKMITRAKLCWTGAVIGLAIVLAAPSFLTEIINILGGSSGITPPGGLTLYQIGVNILNLLLSVFGIIAIISLVIGGGMYLTAYGDEKRVETAKKIVTYSIIGIIVALSAVVIINQVSSLITGS